MRGFVPDQSGALKAAIRDGQAMRAAKAARLARRVAETVAEDLPRRLIEQ